MLRAFFFSKPKGRGETLTLCHNVDIITRSVAQSSSSRGARNRKHEHNSAKERKEERAYPASCLQAALLHCKMALLTHSEEPASFVRGDRIQWVGSVSLRDEGGRLLSRHGFPWVLKRVSCSCLGGRNENYKRQYRRRLAFNGV